MGVARCRHTEYVIGDTLDLGNIDTMCICVRRDLAIKTRWYDGQGGNNDARYIKRLNELTDDFNFNRMIIGVHL